MRPIHLVELDKWRPAVILTREAVRPYLDRVTVAPITTTVRGLAVEVALGQENGLDGASVINCDGVETVFLDQIGRRVGGLTERQEPALAAALVVAFDLRV